MASNPEALWTQVERLLGPDARGRLLARGLARGIVWRDGRLPEGAPEFPETLGSDLLSFGYGLLAAALELKDSEYAPPAGYSLSDVFRVAAEALESAARRDDERNPERGLHLVCSASAFHLGGYAARSFSVLPPPSTVQNLSSCETLLALLLRRDLLTLRRNVASFLASEEHTDEWVSGRLRDETDPFSAEDAVLLVMSLTFHRAVGLADTAFYFGDEESYVAAKLELLRVAQEGGRVGNVPIWWASTLMRHLVDDLWDRCLETNLPNNLGPKWDVLRRDFIDSLALRYPPHIDLWPSQLDAAKRSTNRSDDLVVSLPTSAGKTRIAELCILRALADEQRVVYVTPLRALSAQVERTLSGAMAPVCATVTSLYGASGVTLSDAETLKSANVVVATPEKLDFAIRQDPDVLKDVGLIVFDEGHMIGVGSREIRYEVLVQRLLRRDDADRRRIVCLSAIFSPNDESFRDFCGWLRRDKPGDPVNVDWRPTRQRRGTIAWNKKSGSARLDLLDGERPFVPRIFEATEPRGKRKRAYPQDDKEFCAAVADSFARDGQSVLVYCPRRIQVEALTRVFASLAKLAYLENIERPSNGVLETALAVAHEWLGDSHPATQGLKIGVGTHHGVLPRPFLNEVEKLLDEGLLQVVIASPTLAQGIDLSCATLIFRGLTRFDPASPNKQKLIPVAEFMNVVGRAGRAYVDIDGMTLFPIFDRHAFRKRQVAELCERAKPVTLWSGLVLLVWQIAKIVQGRLGVEVETFTEYVFNSQEIWSDAKLRARSVDDVHEDDLSQKTLAEHLADLDVALLSLLEPLDVETDDLSALLDSVLQSSLWARTVARVTGEEHATIRSVLESRARWIWRTTTLREREACFCSGLGIEPGLFLHQRRGDLVRILVSLATAVEDREFKLVCDLSEELVAIIHDCPHFAVRSLPEDWRGVVRAWVSGAAFRSVLGGGTKNQGRCQVFVQEGLVFKLVWAVEAVRVQALSVGHPDADRLGDAPALVFTYGTPTVEAALLCRTGFSSRVGAKWAVEKIGGQFSNLEEMQEWIDANRSTLDDPSFWPDASTYLLWQTTPFGHERTARKTWRRYKTTAAVAWVDRPPKEGTRIRLIVSDRSVGAYAADLRALGDVQLSPSDIDGQHVRGVVLPDGRVSLDRFGPWTV